MAGSPPFSGSPGVSAEAFDRLAEGQHAHTGEQLIRHRDTIKTQQGDELGHRAGWDLTFNAPKTVSLTALVGEDERVREAHHSAVRAALSETEKYVQARMGGSLAPYRVGDSIRYTRGSESLGLEPKAYATVIHVNHGQNRRAIDGVRRSL